MVVEKSLSVITSSSPILRIMSPTSIPARSAGLFSIIEETIVPLLLEPIIVVVFVWVVN